MKTSVALSTFTILCDHSCIYLHNTFLIPKGNRLSCCTTFSLPSTPPPLSISIYLPVLGISYKCHHTIWGLLHLASWLQDSSAWQWVPLCAFHFRGCIIFHLCLWSMCGFFFMKLLWVCSLGHLWLGSLVGTGFWLILCTRHKVALWPGCDRMACCNSLPPPPWKHNGAE